MQKKNFLGLSTFLSYSFPSRYVNGRNNFYNNLTTINLRPKIIFLQVILFIKKFEGGTCSWYPFWLQNCYSVFIKLFQIETVIMQTLIREKVFPCLTKPCAHYILQSYKKLFIERKLIITQA